MSRLPLLAVPVAFLTIVAGAAPVPNVPPPPPEWPMFGGTPARNMVNFREKLPDLPSAGPDWENAADAKTWEAEWVLWKVDLGGAWSCRLPASAGSPAIANGRVFVGTANQLGRNPRDTQKDADGGTVKLDKGVLMCFDEKSGRFLWQAVHDKLPDGINDELRVGVSATPTVVGNRLYYVSNQCRVVCLDVNGFADGNQGFQNEPYKDATDADIIWEYDMVRELKVFPHYASNCSPLVVGDRVFAGTGNGVDISFVKMPSPEAPALVCLDRHTGKLLWKDNSPGQNVMRGQWSSPAYAAEPVPQVIHGQGDGWLRAFDPATGKLLWQFDGNRKGAKYDIGGTGDSSDFLGMPVVHGGRVYIGTGQAADHSAGIAHLWCIDLKKAVELGAKSKDRDVSPELLVRIERQLLGADKAVTKPNPASALAWVYGGEETRRWAPRDYTFGRTLSTVAVVGDVVYAAELAGYVHCLNANTGEPYWQYDTRASIWGSPLFVDGKVLVATEDGDLFAFRHAAKPLKFDVVEAAKGATTKEAASVIRKAERARMEKACLLAKVELPEPIRSTPAVVNGVLYIATENTLYAIGKK